MVLISCWSEAKRSLLFASAVREIACSIAGDCRAAVSCACCVGEREATWAGVRMALVVIRARTSPESAGYPPAEPAITCESCVQLVGR